MLVRKCQKNFEHGTHMHSYKFLGMCINHKRWHYTSGEGRNKTKRKNIYQSFDPVVKLPQYYTQYIRFQPYCEVPKNSFKDSGGNYI
jgi:plasmid rolling circle replication initiator protein Rep